MKKIFFFILVSLPICVFSATKNNLPSTYINAYNSFIQIHNDGTMTVEETIAVQTDGNVIQHGIYRDIPNDSKMPDGTEKTLLLKIISAQLDNASIHFEANTLDNPHNTRVYIGDKDKILSAGYHVFTLTYLTNSQINFLNDHDELYWNIIGPQWQFPILHAQAIIALPENVQKNISGITAYTGDVGSRAANYTQHRLPNGNIQFDLTAPLQPHQAFTIAVGWPKGLIQIPNIVNSVSFYWQNFPEIKILYLTVFFLLLYYAVCWLLFARRPQAPVVIPFFKVPEDLSPAACCYILDMHYETKIFTAAIIDLAVKGYIKISKNENFEYTLTSIENHEQDKLTVPERQLLNDIFKKSSVVTLDRVSSPLRAAQKRFKKIIKKTYQKTYFKTNSIIETIGVVFALSMIFKCIPLNPWVLNLSVGALIIYFFGRMAYLGYKYSVGARRLAPLYGGVILLIFISVVLKNLNFDPYILIIGIALILLALINVVAGRLLIRPTEAGQKFRSEIKGFKLFLAMSEKDRLNFENPPQKTPELFNAYLAYAFALGVEQKWAQQFSGTLTGDYQPHWYSSSIQTGHFNPTSFAGNLNSGLNSAVTGSAGSSGFSSGGGAGGGGGGGGGGGW